MSIHLNISGCQRGRTMKARPATVTVAAILVFIAAVLYAFAAVVNLVAALRPDSTWLVDAAVNDAYWWVNAVLDGLLALLFAGLGTRLLQGDEAARVTTIVLGIISAVFALFSISHYGVGWGEMIAGLVAAGLLSTNSAKVFCRASGAMSPF
jgi:hypothetical protein